MPSHIDNPTLTLHHIMKCRAASEVGLEPIAEVSDFRCVRTQHNLRCFRIMSDVAVQRKKRQFKQLALRIRSPKVKTQTHPKYAEPSRRTLKGKLPRNLTFEKKRDAASQQSQSNS
jgi:hypothetical protein